MMKKIMPLVMAICVLSACKDAPKNGANGQTTVADSFYSSSVTTGKKTADVGQNSSAANNATATANNKPAVKMMELPAPLNDRPEKILRRKGYTTSYNSKTKNPNWVAWHLTKSHTYGQNQRSKEVFHEDEQVAAPRATDWDYYNSRYDRGHMCPAGDNKWDATAMNQTFLFTNICPQNHGLNKYEWNDVEIMCRDWARQYGAIDIVCGPIYYGRGEQKTVGKNKVWVPDAFFKVVLCRQGQPKAIGFIYRNEGRKQQMVDAVHTVDDIERITGMDFFPALADDVENRVEAKAELSKW